MKQKYCDSYLEHYIICYEVTNCEPIRDGYRKLTHIFKSIEGIDSCNRLVDEIKTIQRNNEWQSYIEYFKSCNINLTLDKLIEMTNTAVEVINSFDQKVVNK